MPAKGLTLLFLLSAIHLEGASPAPSVMPSGLHARMGLQPLPDGTPISSDSCLSVLGSSLRSAMAHSVTLGKSTPLWPLTSLAAVRMTGRMQTG